MTLVRDWAPGICESQIKNRYVIAFVTPRLAASWHQLAVDDCPSNCRQTEPFKSCPGLRATVPILKLASLKLVELCLVAQAVDLVDLLGHDPLVVKLVARTSQGSRRRVKPGLSTPWNLV